MKSLYGILTDPSKKVRFEVLIKCEEVLKKLYEKVEGPDDGDSRSYSSPSSGFNRNQRNYSPQPSAPTHNRSRESTPRSPDRDPRPPPGGQPSRFNRKGVGLLGDAPPPAPSRGGPPNRPDPWGGRGAPAGGRPR